MSNDETPDENGIFKKDGTYIKSWWGAGILNNIGWGLIYKPKDNKDE